MKFRNPRAGHGPAFGVEILYFVAGLILGWPIAVPTLFVMGFLSERLGFGLSGPVSSAILYLGMIAGVYVHFKIWAFLWSALKTWWIE